ncbi:hypothetical protein [Acidisoma sp. 7E03]
MRRNEESDCRPLSDAQTGGADSPVMVAESDAAEDGARRKRQTITQFPMQILVPEETRDALRQRSAETGASIRHIILRSLAADGFPVPKLSRWRD